MFEEYDKRDTRMHPAFSLLDLHSYLEEGSGMFLRNIALFRLQGANTQKTICFQVISLMLNNNDF
jgi:hypothetical protein